MFLMKRHAHFNIPEPECFGHFWGSGVSLTKNHRPILPQVTRPELPTACHRSLQPTVGRQKPWPRGKTKRWNFVRNPQKIQPGKPFVLFFFKATMCWVLMGILLPKKCRTLGRRSRKRFLGPFFNVGGFSPTHFENMLYVKLNHLPRVTG